MRVFKLAIVVATLMYGAPAGARDFKSSDIFPASYPTVRAVAYMGDLMRERSGGRLNLSDLGADDQTTESFTLGQLRNGTLDMARVNIAALNSAAPATVVLTLPYLFRSTAHERRVLDGPIGEEILASLERAGFIGLCFYRSRPEIDLWDQAGAHTGGPARPEVSRPAILELGADGARDGRATRHDALVRAARLQCARESLTSPTGTGHPSSPPSIIASPNTSA